MTPVEAALEYARRGWRVVPLVPGERKPWRQTIVFNVTKRHYNQVRTREANEREARFLVESKR